MSKRYPNHLKTPNFNGMNLIAVKSKSFPNSGAIAHAFKSDATQPHDVKPSAFSSGLGILAINTGNECCSVALSIESGAIIQSQSAEKPQRHSEILLPMVNELLLAQQVALQQLDAIAVNIGPGAFTGVRLGVSVTQGLAYAANIPVIPIISLQAIAQTYGLNHQVDQVVVAIDARMKEVYWGVYQWDDVHKVAREVKKPAVSPASDIQLLNQACHVVGNGWGVEDIDGVSLSSQYSSMSHDDGVSCTAESIMLSAQVLLQQGLVEDVMTLQPCYVRDQVVQSKSLN